MNRALVLTLFSIVTVSTLAQQLVHQLAGAGTLTKAGASQAVSNLSPSQIFSRARISVVVIITTNGGTQREALGSGFIVSHDKIATNHHVVEGMTEASVVFSDGDVKPVSKVTADSAEQDLIILTVETGGRSPLAFGDEMALQQGDPVYALGAPKGLELTFKSGIVSSFRKSNGQFLIQTTAPIAPGSSGGPLFDRSGRVVGVTTSLISEAPGIYFSVGVGDLKRLVKTPEAIVLPLDEWTRRQVQDNVSESSNIVAPNGQDAVSSLADIVHWMEKFSGAHAHWTSEGGSMETDFVTKLPSIYGEPDGCSIGIVHRVEGSVGDILDLRKINLEDIDVTAVVQNEYEVSITTSSSSYRIERVISRKDGQRQDALVDRSYIAFDSEQNASQFAIALRRTAGLCAGDAP